MTQGKLQMNCVCGRIYSVIMSEHSTNAVYVACVKLEPKLKNCQLVLDKKDKTVYNFIKDGKTIAYFWYIRS